MVLYSLRRLKAPNVSRPRLRQGPSPDTRADAVSLKGLKSTAVVLSNASNICVARITLTTGSTSDSGNILSPTLSSAPSRVDGTDLVFGDTKINPLCPSRTAQS